MTGSVAFSFARVRLQAHYAKLLPPPGWVHLLQIQDFVHFVQMVRDTPLRPWALNFSPQTDAHQIEAHLRHQFRARVAEVAGWVPKNWSSAIRWVARLPDLSALEFLAHGHPPYDWMSLDPVLGKTTVATPDEGVVAVAGLLQAGQAEINLHEHWITHWRQLWPPMPKSELRLLQELQDGLRLVLRPSSTQLAAAVEADQAVLQMKLHQMFRWHSAEPVAAFAFLALYWLEMVRLRGALLRRRLLPANDTEGQA